MQSNKKKNDPVKTIFQAFPWGNLFTANSILSLCTCVGEHALCSDWQPLFFTFTIKYVYHTVYGCHSLACTHTNIGGYAFSLFFFFGYTSIAHKNTNTCMCKFYTIVSFSHIQNGISSVAFKCGSPFVQASIVMVHFFLVFTIC